ncbi:MAG: DUF4173 domain-containing protein, partial [Actinomycetia bacterium]|nr:DUF4173 domain-containing protein [Actinomycetes bacterium]
MDKVKRIRYWIATLLIVVGLVELFLFSRPALGYMLCNLLLLAAYFCLWDKNAKPRMIDSLFIATIVALALPYALFNNLTLRVLNAIALFFCWSVLIVRRVAGSEISWDRPIFLAEAAFSWLIRPFAALVAPWRETFQARRVARQTATEPEPASPRKSGRASVVFQIIIAVCIVLPTLAVLIFLLMQSDPIFARYARDVFQWIHLPNIGETAWHLIVMIILLPFVASFVWTIRARRLFLISEKARSRGALPADRPRFIPGLTAAIVLISVNVVYLAYAAVQFIYLFSGFSGALPDGLTYASYARRGFAELVAVAVINIVIVLVATRLTRRRGAAGVVVRVCNFVLVVLAGVQLASAAMRMSLYTQAYGLSQMRLFVFVFQGLIAAFFLILLAREFSERVPLFKLGVFATLAALIALNYMVPDACIARYNITHYLAGDLQVKELDLDYLWSGLSVDSSLVVLDHADAIAALGPKYADRIATLKEDLVSQPRGSLGSSAWGYLCVQYQDRGGEP